MIPLHFLESILRRHLDNACARRLSVIDPVKLTISNLKENRTVPANYYPKNPEKGTYDLTVSSTLFVEREDVRE
jgi:glutaminyl-tRNA synthetase